MKKILAFLMIAILSTVALAEGSLYAGIDPWGNPLSVTLEQPNALSGVWNQNFYGELFILICF